MIEKFRTSIEVSIYEQDLLGEDVDDVQSVMIEWGLGMDLREWGVKDIYPFVPDQTLELYYDTYDEKTDDYISKHKSIKISNVEVDIFKSSLQLNIVPYELVYFRGTWTLEF